ncbi:MAG: NAD-dependent epimerase/dehydratase family protein [Gemmatimonadales bacterium]
MAIRKPAVAPAAIVCGAGGFIGHHLVTKLKSRGYTVRGVDLKLPEYGPSSADEFLLLDLRNPAACVEAVSGSVPGGGPAEVYQLAADMGGMGFISGADCEMLRDNAAINANMIHASAEAGNVRYFFASSVCIYRDMLHGEAALSEDDAYPALPANEYGWEKLYSERVALAYARRYRMDVRIARFQNCYGPEGAWQGGREKVPAAVCRKVAAAQPGDVIELWGDGSAVRSFVYVDDLVDAVLRLMASDVAAPTNIGSREYVSIAKLFEIVAAVAGKNLRVRYVPGPVGVQSRNFSNARIESLGWQAKVSLEEGVGRTYKWVSAQVAAAGDDSDATLSSGNRAALRR